MVEKYSAISAWRFHQKFTNFVVCKAPFAFHCTPLFLRCTLKKTYDGTPGRVLAAVICGPQVTQNVNPNHLFT